MIPAEVIHRIFRVKFGPSDATAFTIEVDGREYLVSAKHVLAGLKSGDKIEIFSNGKWVQFEANLVGHAAGDLDVSVLALPTSLTPPNLPLVATSDGIVYGQEAFFLGFPYGFMGTYSFGPMGFPLPFVKSATVSMFDPTLVYLDGHNNPGFSGGPVVFRDMKTTKFKVAALISGYRAMNEPIFYGGAATQLNFRYNTGIVVSYRVEIAVNLARANPIGAKI